jgi:hypothetical protein
MTVGIVGAGQLGRMLALAGYPLGLDFLFLDRSRATPGAPGRTLALGEFTDRRLLASSRRRSEVITFDWENVSVESLAALGAAHAHRAAAAALAAAQDRLAEKRLFERLGIPTTRTRGRFARRLRARRRRDRPARRAEDPPPGLRRQGPGGHAHDPGHRAAWRRWATHR